jgi:hypothetical protein
MIRSVRMNAAYQPRRFFRVARSALYRRDMLGVRIFFDVAVAIRAFQASMDAGMKLLRIHADTVPRPILHPGVAMAAQAVCLRLVNAGRRQRQKQASEKSEGKRGNGFHGVSGQFLPLPERERKAFRPSPPRLFFPDSCRAVRLCFVCSYF